MATGKATSISIARCSIKFPPHSQLSQGNEGFLKQVGPLALTYPSKWIKVDHRTPYQGFHEIIRDTPKCLLACSTSDEYFSCLFQMVPGLQPSCLLIILTVQDLRGMHWTLARLRAREAQFPSCDYKRAGSGTSCDCVVAQTASNQTSPDSEA